MFGVVRRMSPLRDANVAHALHRIARRAENDSLVTESTL
jgi:hypothetical protein